MSDPDALVETGVGTAPTRAAVLYELVAALEPVDAGDLHNVYERLAPLIYRGTVAQPVGRRERRRVLRQLAEDGTIEAAGDRRHRTYRTADGRDGGLAVEGVRGP
jgi:hypothetical protein